nr:hypothetical protein [Tanacetum cinerariifolium]
MPSSPTLMTSARVLSGEEGREIEGGPQPITPLNPTSNITSTKTLMGKGKWRRHQGTSRSLLAELRARHERNPRRISGSSSNAKLSGEKGLLGNLNRVGSHFGYFKEGDGVVIRPFEAKDIVEIVNLAHSQRIVVHNVRPSCFVMASFNRVSFIESLSCFDSGSCEDSCEDELQNQTVDYMGVCSSLGRNQYVKDCGNLSHKV